MSHGVALSLGVAARSSRMALHLWTILLLSPIAAGAAGFAMAADLAGTWSYELIEAAGARETLGQISIKQTGDGVTGDWSAPSARMRDEFGFEAGDRLLEGTVEGAVLRGRLRLHYAVKVRAACPEDWQTWANIEIALGDDPHRLQGRFRSSPISEQDCSKGDLEWFHFALTRELPQRAPSADRASPEPTGSGPLAESTFGGGNEGWLLTDMAGAPTLAAQHVGEGGNPGGYIAAGIEGGAGFSAPVAFLGDRSEAAGGVLLFDLKGQQTDSPAQVVLRGEDATLVHAVEPPPAAGWATHSVRLDPTANWLVQSTGQPAIQADLTNVLSLLKGLAIQAPAASGLDNIVLTRGSATAVPATAAPPADPKPQRIELALDEISASPGEALNLRIFLANAEGEPVPADRIYEIRLDADRAEVRPDVVELPEGARLAASRVYGRAPGNVQIRGTAVEGNLQAGEAEGVSCGTDEVERIVLNAGRQESTIRSPIIASLYLANASGVVTSGGSGDRVISVKVEGVGKVEPSGVEIREGRCAAEVRLDADRPGESAVTFSLGSLPPEQRTFRFHLPFAQLAAILAAGGLLGGFVQAAQGWKNSRRWKIERWLVTAALSVIAGLTVYLVYSLGLVEVMPQLPLGYAPALLLSIVGGYLGPAALERISARVLPPDRKDA